MTEQKQAEKIAVCFRGIEVIPENNSFDFMYCGMLDMRFLFDKDGTPFIAPAGCILAGNKNCTEGKPLEAFRGVRQALSTMKELAEEAQE